MIRPKTICIHFVVTTKIERYHDQNDSAMITQTIFFCVYSNKVDICMYVFLYQKKT